MGPFNMHVLILAALIDNWVFGSSGARQTARELTEGMGLLWLLARLKGIHIIMEVPWPNH